MPSPKKEKKYEKLHLYFPVVRGNMHKKRSQDSKLRMPTKTANIQILYNKLSRTNKYVVPCHASERHSCTQPKTYYVKKFKKPF